MAVDKNKISADASRLVQKGQFDKAIRAYEKILREDAGDVRVLLKIGEIQQKKGDSPAAADTFRRVAEAYAQQGFFLKAVAVYKQVMKVAPDDVRVNERLAQLYQQLGLVSEAMGQLQLIAAWSERHGDDTKMLDSLRRVVELDPENVPASVKLGDVYARQDQHKIAVEHFRRAAEQLKRNSRVDEYMNVAERIAALVPEDWALARELAAMFLARGDTRRALAKLQACFKADPRHVETLTLLAQAFHDLGQTSKMASVFRALAGVHAESGNASAARAAWRRVLDLAPDDPEAHEALGPDRAVTPPPAELDPAPARAPAAQPATPAGNGAPAPAPGAVAQPGGVEAIPKLLADTDVYVKYGLHEKALDHLQKVFAIDPDHLEGREKAARVRELRSDTAGAADEYVRIVRLALARGLPDRARAGLARIRELVPGHPALAELGSSLAGGDAAEPSIDEGVILEIEETAAVESDDVALQAAVEPVQEILEADEILDDLRPPTREAVPAEPAPHQEPPAQDLEEAEFFLGQGLLAEARELLNGLLASHPDHPGVQARLRELERIPAAAEVPAPRPTPVRASTEDEYLYSVKDVLEPFKKGIEKTVTADDSETHYELGIAYKEMGLLEDALHEFEVALRGGKEVDCLTMIGLCRIDRGDAAGAIEAYRRATRTKALTPETQRAIEYQLALAYELAGDPAVAVYYLNRVVEGDPGYRDAKADLARLGGGQGHPPADREAEPAVAVGDELPREPAGSKVGSA